MAWLVAPGGWAMVAGMEEAPLGPGRERRVSDRVRVRMAVAVHLLDPRADGTPADHAVMVMTGELVDVAVDGRGAAVRVPVGPTIPVGGPVRLSFDSGQTVVGVVVSRLGLRGKSRLGVRVDRDDRKRLRELAVDPSRD